MIGIDASRAFISNRTGIEEYSYQVITGLMNELKDHQVVLYIRKEQKIDFNIPDNWKIREIRLPYLWTQIGLSLEMIFHPVDVLFVPAHIVPWITPQKTVVTIHGLEYEFCARAYSFWERLYMRFFIKRSCRKASKIIAVSENTKNDLVRLYNVPKEKIEVIYEGVEISSSPLGGGCPEDRRGIKSQTPSLILPSGTFSLREKGTFEKFLLFIGRIEERKNISGILQAFEILKEKYKIPHKLILAGRPGYGYEKIKNQMSKSKYGEEIASLGFISEEEKWALLEGAEVFLFPTFYEGFGLPILEAESFGTPVITSNVSSMPEVAGESAVLVNPKNPQEIAEGVYKLISDQSFRDDIIEKGRENVKRFSWEKCAKEIAEVLVKK